MNTSHTTMEEVSDFRRSMVVPSVQDLVSRNPQLISAPPRYVQSQPLDHAVDFDDLHVPIIDMEALLNGDPYQLQNLHYACKDWGFFQAVNHGVSESLIKRVKKDAKELFELPMEEKMKLWQTLDKIDGFGQTFVVSEKQKLDWSDAFLLRTLPTNLRMPHIWSKLPPQFRETMENYATEVKRLKMEITKCLGQTLGEETREYLSNIFDEELVQVLRINYYPPCPEPEKVIGTSPHSDVGGITILYQANEIEGLQIKKDGNWIPLNPLPNAFIVNLGDILEIVSNGIYKSVEHRVVVNKNKERISIAAFHTPSHDKVFGPSPGLVSPDNPARFQASNKTREYLQGFFAAKLSGKTHLDLLRINNS